MTSQDDDFNARIKRVKVKSEHRVQLPNQARARSSGFDERDMRLAILLPQLALVLGALALIAGRGIAMNYLGVEPSTAVLGWGEGALILLLLFVVGLLFGKSQTISHGALVVGASLAFLGESYYIPAAPDLMAFIYTPNYVAQVVLSAG